MAYTKLLNNVEVTTRSGTEAEAHDAVKKADATYAIEAIDAKDKIVKVATTLIPFHAIDHAVVTKGTTEVDKGDAHGCKSGDSVVCGCTVCNATIC